MKRIGDLWPRIVAFENLLDAALKARQGKRHWPNVMAFHARQEEELLALHRELIEQTYVPGPYRTFRIVEPKPRMISAAPYRDRVVHHALMNVMGPVFERGYIHDTYANRTGFGSHRALRRFTGFLRSSHLVLKCDIRKYFPSIDHAILKDLIRRRIKCPEALWLVDTILDASNPQEEAVAYFPGDDLFSVQERRRGLPIGNLTSQSFGNLYLSGFDHFVKERLGGRKYLRYVDDFALFSDDRADLEASLQAMGAYLATLRLRMNPSKTQLLETRQGCSFVGFHVLPDRIRLCAANLARARRRFTALQRDYRTGCLGMAKLQERVQAWCAHAAHGDTWRLRANLFGAMPFRRASHAR